MLLSTPSTDAPVVVNRDLHLGTVLAAEREPWLVTDPKPLVGEPTFDGGHRLAAALDGDATVDRAEQVSVLIADELGVAANRLRAWALVGAVDFALLTLARTLIELGG